MGLLVCLSIPDSRQQLSYLQVFINGCGWNLVAYRTTLWTDWFLQDVGQCKTSPKVTRYVMEFDIFNLHRYSWKTLGTLGVWKLTLNCLTFGWCRSRSSDILWSQISWIEDVHVVGFKCVRNIKTFGGYRSGYFFGGYIFGFWWSTGPYVWMLEMFNFNSCVQNEVSTYISDKA